MFNHVKDLAQKKVVPPCFGEYQSPIKAMLNNNLPVDENDSKQNKIITHSDVLKSLELFMNTLRVSNKSGLSKLKVKYLIQFNFIIWFVFNMYIICILHAAI